MLGEETSHLYGRVAIFFKRHCEISALEQEMTKYTNTLPESAQQRFRAFTQATATNLRGRVNADLRRDEPAGREQVTAQEHPRKVPVNDGLPEQRRESVKLRLQQHKENTVQHATEQSYQSHRTAKRARPAGLGQ